MLIGWIISCRSHRHSTFNFTIKRLTLTVPNTVFPQITSPYNISAIKESRWLQPSLFSFCVVLLCVFTFWVSCCDVHWIKSMICSSLPPVICYLLYVYLFTHIGVQRILRCVYLCYYSLLCPFLIAPSVYSNVYFIWLCCLDKCKGFHYPVNLCH